MIKYHPGDWGIVFAFSLQGSVFPKSFAWALPCSICAASLNALLRLHPELEGAVHPGEKAATILHGFTFILGFLVVFRAQQANKRWEEGGALLEAIRGEWFNAFSNLLAFCNTDPQMRSQTLQFKHALSRLVSLMYNCALQQVSAVGQNDFEMLGLDGFDEQSLQYLTQVHDRVEVVMQWIQKMIVEADRDKVIHISPPILSRVYNQLGNGIVKVAAARKISAYPLPFPYAQMVTCMLVLHWIMTPLLCAAMLSHPMWAFMLSFVVTFGYWSVNYIGVELEMPFGDDANDLPTDALMIEINRSLMSLLHESSLKVPFFHFDEESHTKFSPQRMNFDKYVEASIAVHRDRLMRKGTSAMTGTLSTLSELQLEGADSPKLNSSPSFFNSAQNLKPIAEVGPDIENAGSFAAGKPDPISMNKSLSVTKAQEKSTLTPPLLQGNASLESKMIESSNGAEKVVLRLDAEMQSLSKSYSKIAEEVRLIRQLGEQYVAMASSQSSPTMSSRATKLLNIPPTSKASSDPYRPPTSPWETFGAGQTSCCDIWSAQKLQIPSKGSNP
jgi:putative membrane protein